MNQYPMVALFVRHGTAIAAAIAALPLLAGITALAFGCHWIFVPAGALIAAVVFVLMKSYSELVAIIADMLLPK